MSIHYRTHHPDLDDAIVVFWNRVFRDKRNAVPFTRETWRARVTSRVNLLEPFEPDKLLLAMDGERVAGMLHCGIRSEEYCRVVHGDDWAGGAQGFVGIIAVLESHRRRGIGSELLRRAREITGDPNMALDGQCLNPYYGNSEAPFTVPWGTTEGISVDWDDDATRGFFARHGYQPRFKGVSYFIDLADFTDDPQCHVKDLEGKEYKVLHCKNYCPEIGKTLDDWKVFKTGYEFDTIAATEDGMVVSTVVGYAMTGLEPGRHAIYELQTSPEHMGRGYGRAALSFWMFLVRRKGAAGIEVLTIPEVSPAAARLYEKAGFSAVHEGAVY